MRFDCEFAGSGAADLFMISEPPPGWRAVEATGRRAAVDSAEVLRWLVLEVREEAEGVVQAMDHLNAHEPASPYEAFPSEQNRRIDERLEIHQAPKRGSRPNMVEVERSAPARRRQDRRIESAGLLRREVEAWGTDRNERMAVATWRFTAPEARIKLRRLYPASQRKRPARPACRISERRTCEDGGGAD